MTTNDSDRLKEIRERHRETIDHCNMGTEEGPCDRCIGYYAQANAAIPYLLKQLDTAQKLNADLLPAAKEWLLYMNAARHAFIDGDMRAVSAAVVELEGN